MYMLLLRMILFAQLSAPQLSISSQTDWSGGSGYPGPVTEWRGVFSTSSSVYSMEAGSLCLLMVPDIRETEILLSEQVACDFQCWGDINLDGYDDYLVVTSQDSIIWFENSGDTISVWPVQYIAHIPDIRTIELMERSGGTPRFVVNYWSGDSSFVDVYRRYPSGSWNSYRLGNLGESGYGTGARTGYVDDNDTQDVVGWKWGWDEVSVWWDADPDAFQFLLSPHCPTDVFIFDGDGDGDGELAVDKSWYPETQVFWNEGGSWPASLLPDFFYGYELDAGDLDQDGTCELAGISYSLMYLFRRYVDWTYTIFPGHSEFCSFINLNNDSLLDIAGFYNGVFGFHYNKYPPGTFQHIQYETECYGYRMYRSDVNGDQKDDLVLSFVGTGESRWYDLDASLSTEGMLESSILYLGCDPDWSAIDWTSYTPSGTSVEFQIRASDDPEQMGPWSDTLLSPCSLEGILEDGDSYLQYKVVLRTDDPSTSPVLEEVSFYWDPLGIAPGEGGGPWLRAVPSNPARVPVYLDCCLPRMSDMTLMVFDVSGRLIFRSHLEEAHAGIHRCSLCHLRPGVYFGRMSAGDSTASVRFIVID